MPRCGTLGDLFLILVHRGATAASRKRQCRGDTRIVCTPPAGCGKQSRDLTRLCTVFRPRSGQRRDARATKVRVAGAVHSPNSAAKFNIPVMKRSTGRIQNQPASAYFVPVKQKMKEVICPSLMRIMAGEYPETPSIWEHWHAPVQVRRLLTIRAGERLPENKALSNEGAFVLEEA